MVPAPCLPGRMYRCQPAAFLFGTDLRRRVGDGEVSVSPGFKVGGGGWDALMGTARIRDRIDGIDGAIRVPRIRDRYDDLAGGGSGSRGCEGHGGNVMVPPDVTVVGVVPVEI